MKPNNSINPINQHVQKLGNLSIPTIPESHLHWSEKRGIHLYRNNPFLRDIATFMEHPENYAFYKKYMEPEKISVLLSILKIYQSISSMLEKSAFPYNAYHKIFLLYTLLKNPNYSKFITGRNVPRISSC